MAKKTALITGVTGQDGAYLAELLLTKGYSVHGIKRRTSLINTDRIDHLYHDPHEQGLDFALHHGDLTDSSSLIRIVEQVQPDEIYNLAAQSHVAVSFVEPEYTANSDALGTLRILEAIRTLGLEKKTRFYQASTSELYGLVQETPQKEDTPFYPRSPYAVAKLYAYWITVNYREAYGLYACNGILFNHESPVRGETFVTRKITRALARIQHSALNAESSPLTSHQLPATGSVIVRVDPRYFRPTEVETLLGDATKAKEKLGWMAEVTFPELVAEMVASDLDIAKRDALVAKEGFKVYTYHE